MWGWFVSSYLVALCVVSLLDIRQFPNVMEEKNKNEGKEEEKDENENEGDEK